MIQDPLYLPSENSSASNEDLDRLRELAAAEAALRKRDVEFATILRTATDGFWITDRNGRFLEVNDTVCRNLGYRRDELLRMSVSDIETVENPEEIARVVRRVMDRGSDRFDGKYRRKDGSVLDVEVSANYLPPPHDCFFAFLRDVTARKRGEEKLRLANSYNRSLIEASLDPLVTIDASGKITDVNSATERATGCSREQLIGTDFSDYFTEPERARSGYQQAFSMGSVQDYALEIRHRDGGVKPVLYNATVYRDASGKILGVFAAARDITEQMRKAEELRQSEKLLNNILDILPIGLFILDAKGEIVRINTAARQIWGEAKLVGKEDWCEYKAWWPKTGIPVEIEEWAAMHALREGKVTLNDEVEIRAFDGTRKIIHNSAVPIRNARQEIVGAIVLNEDITDRIRLEDERRRMEDKMRHVQKLESLGVLAGGIAHDFNNLLMVIIGYTDLAQMKLPPDSPGRECLAEVEKASRRAADLCRQMLAYSGRGRFVVEPLDLNEVVKDMGNMLEMSVSKKAMVKFRFQSDLPRIEADPAQLRQVVMNLIINASEAISNNPGVITVATGAVRCDRAYLQDVGPDMELPEGLYVSLEVSDTGCGMDESTRKKVFDPFFTTKFTGRGLGLAAVLGIIRGHKGVIQVSSEPGVGSSFKVLFPASGKAAGLSEGKEPPKAGWKGTGTILLADDEEMVREVGINMLESLGFRVLAAADGREAVEIFRGCKEEIVGVLLDLTMPRMDGEEALREIRRTSPDARVILTSGYNEQQATQRFFGKGLAGFLQKPYKLEALSTMLRQVLGSP